jgi:hypothetical protein
MATVEITSAMASSFRGMNRVRVKGKRYPRKPRLREKIVPEAHFLPMADDGDVIDYTLMVELGIWDAENGIGKKGQLTFTPEE